jgi:hypothetical protein
MKKKRRYQRNKKLGIKNNNDMHEIELSNSESTEILFCLLNKYGIVYFEQYNNTLMNNIHVYRRDIDKIYNILLNELSGNGVDAVTGLNDYGLRIDNLCGIFGLIKGEKDELEKIANKLYHSRG